MNKQKDFVSRPKKQWFKPDFSSLNTILTSSVPCDTGNNKFNPDGDDLLNPSNSSFDTCS